MPVKVKCSGCEAVLNAPDKARGKAVKCPKCGTPIRVPAEGAARPAAKPKPASVVSDDSNDFLAAFDLGRVEDRSTRVCPKCGTIVGAEDVDCPMCGADLATGGMGTAQRARAGRKGAAPSEFYNTAFREGLKYVGKKQALAWKSVMMFAVFGVLAMIGWLMFVWCHRTPPQAFWIFVSSILTLFLPGWIWLVQNQLIKRILEPKREKYPVRLEPFIAVSLGIKAIAWTLIFGLPIWMLLGLPGLVLTKMESGSGPILLMVASGLFALLALVSWPVAQAHFAMPITWPGWAVHKVLPDVGKNIGPSLYWAVIAVMTAIPVAGVGVGGYFLGWKDLQGIADTLAYNADVNGVKAEVEYLEKEKQEVPPALTESAKRETKDIPWKNLLLPSAAIALTALPLGFWLVLNGRTAAYFVKLYRPNIDELILHEKEYVYVAKSAEERDKAAEAANTWTATFLSVVVLSALGLAGGVVYATFSDVGYLKGIGTGIWIAGLLLLFGSRVAIAKIAWEESAGWGIGVFLIDLVLIIYCIRNWGETKFAFVQWMLTLPMFFFSGILFGLSEAMSGAEAAAAAAPAAPGG
jgi:hypothetical protein